MAGGWERLWVRTAIFRRCDGLRRLAQTMQVLYNPLLPRLVIVTVKRWKCRDRETRERKIVIQSATATSI